MPVLQNNLEVDVEEWRPIQNKPGYEVSNLGRVRSIDREIHQMNKHGFVNKRLLTGRMLKLQSFPNEYLAVHLGRGGCMLVHRLVAAAFIPGNTLLQVNHKNGVRTDNRAENLEWISCSDNHKHSYISLNRKTHMWTNQVEIDGQVFPSQNAAARHLGVHGASVASAIIYGHKVRGHTVKLIKGESNHARKS